MLVELLSPLLLFRLERVLIGAVILLLKLLLQTLLLLLVALSQALQLASRSRCVNDWNALGEAYRLFSSLGPSPAASSWFFSSGVPSWTGELAVSIHPCSRAFRASSKASIRRHCFSNY